MSSGIHSGWVLEAVCNDVESVCLLRDCKKLSHYWEEVGRVWLVRLNFALESQAGPRDTIFYGFSHTGKLPSACQTIVVCNVCIKYSLSWSEIPILQNSENDRRITHCYRPTCPR